MSLHLTVLSLGAGVQSSTLALMAACGEVTPMLDAAIFADTKSEPKAVYKWLDWLEKQLPFPVHRVSAGNLGADIARSVGDPLRHRVGQAPFYVAMPGEVDEGMLWRQCTKEYKVAVIERKLRELLGAAKGRSAPKGATATVWKGISLDEQHRAKPSKLKYVRSAYPLIDRRMTRGHCLEWMERHGYPRPPRSACTFCPYHDDAYWAAMKRETPSEFRAVVAFDKHIRKGLPEVKGEAYLHRTLKPLGEIEFDESDQMDLFACAAGVCGV